MAGQARAKTIQRFGILGDIHTEDETLAAAVEFLSREGVDAILAVGDIVDGPGSACAPADDGQ